MKALKKLAQPFRSRRRARNAQPNLPDWHNVGEVGQSIVIIALLMVGMIAILVLVYDAGTAYAERRRMQNAADAGALTAAQMLAVGSSTDAQIAAAISEYTQTRNGAQNFSATYFPGGQAVGGGSVPSDATGATVHTRIAWNTFFGPLLGVPLGEVGADAACKYECVKSMNQNVYPLAIRCDQPSLSDCGFEFGAHTKVLRGSNFGWLAWNGDNGTPALISALSPPGSVSLYSDPYSGSTQLQIGNWVQGVPKTKHTPELHDVLDFWIQQGAQGIPMAVVIYDCSSGEKKCYNHGDEGKGSKINYHIAGFAAFILETFDDKDSSITGRFIKYVLPGGFTSACSETWLKTVHCIPSGPVPPMPTVAGATPLPSPTATVWATLTSVPAATSTSTVEPPDTPAPFDTPVTSGPDSCGYPYASANPLTNIAFNESGVLRAYQLTSNSMNVFYNDEHALTLGVRQVTVRRSSGSNTTTYSVSPMLLHPADGILAPEVGTLATSGEQAGVDASGRPMWPALFWSDITSDATNKSGDWQQGGPSYQPNGVYGTWKAAIRYIDNTRGHTNVTPDGDPAENGWNLDGGDAAPSGLKDEGYGAEVKWNLGNLGLVGGHKYRIQVMVHDGDQNKQGGDAGEACVILTVPSGGITGATSTPLPTSPPTPVTTPTPCGTLGKPGLHLSKSGTTVTIDWNNISGATSYNIYRSTTSDKGPFSLYVNTTDSVATDTIAKGQQFWYYGAAVNACGEGPIGGKANIKG